MVNKAKTLYNRNQNINKNTELASKSIFCPKYAPHGKTDKLFSPPPPTPKKKKGTNGDFSDKYQNRLIMKSVWFKS